MGDCHLGAWSQPEIRALNSQSFMTAIDICIKKKVEFVLISGDLFDSAYPSIETLKEAFQEFRKLKESNIPVFLIAGSHDYSASGKTFLEVLEHAGFCRNVALFIEQKEMLVLQPTIYKNVALYGYPGKKSGLEMQEIKNIKLNDSPGFFKILLLHTAIRDAVGDLPIDAVDHNLLPKVDYLALSHLHIVYQKPGRAYSGPLFPNNISELEELKHGFFYIFENGKIQREDIRLREVLVLNLEIQNTISATKDIITLLQSENIKDKILLLKFSGIISKGKIADINFSLIEESAKKIGAYAMLKSTSKLYLPEAMQELISSNSIFRDEEIQKNFEIQNPGKFNILLPQLLQLLQLEKNEEERSSLFEERLFTESKKLFAI